MNRQDEEESDGASHERWLVSYADFITLMFAFFAVLYATSTRDVEKTKQFQDSVRRYLIKAGAFGGTGEKVNQGERFTSPIEPPIQTFQKGNPLTQETFDEVEGYLEEALSQEDRKKFVYDVQLDELGVRVIIAASPLFATNNVKLSESALPFISKIGNFLAKVGRRVIVEGHVTGPQVANATYPTPWEFAGARATALVRYFIKIHKMDSTLFVPISYGDQRPLTAAKGKGPAALNERIELVILTEDVSI